MNRTLPIWITLAGIALVVSLVIVANALAADDSPDGSPPLIEPLVNAPHADERWTIPLNAAYAPIWGADGCRFGLTLHHRYPYAWEPLRVVELDGRLDLRIDGDYPVKYHTWVRLGDADRGWISRMAYAETAGPNVRLSLDAWEYLHAPGGTLAYPLTVGLEVAIEGYEWGTCSDSLNPIQAAVWSSRPELTVSVPDGVPPHLVDARSLGQRLDAQVASPSSIGVRWEPAPALDYDSWEVEHTTDVSDPTWTALGTLTSPQDSAAPLEWLYDPGVDLTTGVHRFRVRGYSQASFDQWQGGGPNAPDGYGEWTYASVTVRDVQPTPTPAPTATPVPTVTPIPFIHIIQMTPTPVP